MCVGVRHEVSMLCILTVFCVAASCRDGYDRFGFDKDGYDR